MKTQKNTLYTMYLFLFFFLITNNIINKVFCFANKTIHSNIYAVTCEIKALTLWYSGVVRRSVIEATAGQYVLVSVQWGTKTGM